MVVVAVAVLLGAGAGAGWSVVRTQYYVGVADDEVAIFRGVRGSLLGVDLSSVHTETELRVDSLPDFAQDEVREGIHADGLEDARAIVDRLRVNAAGSGIPTPSPVPTVQCPSGLATCAPAPIPPATGSPANVPASPR